WCWLCSRRVPYTTLFRSDVATEVSRRFGEALRSGGDAMIAGIARNQMPSADSLAPINENRSQSIQFGNVYIYGANDDTVAKHQQDRKSTRLNSSHVPNSY